MKLGLKGKVFRFIGFNVLYVPQILVAILGLGFMISTELCGVVAGRIKELRAKIKNGGF